jgi:hypothetical protein
MQGRAGDQDDGKYNRATFRASAAEVVAFAADTGGIPRIPFDALLTVGGEAASMLTSNEYHQGVEACYRFGQ